jgi:hypothetical protein
VKTPTTRPSTSPSRLSSATNPQPSKRLTIAAVTAELRAIGVTIRHHDGEYRVNLKGGSPASEYFTDDLADALGTGRDMAKRGAVVRNLQDYSATCADCGAQKVTVTDEGLCVRCSSKKERARGANVEPRCITQPSNAATIPALIAKLKATFDGDSNDEEHDAAVELVDALEAQPSKTWTAPNATAFLKMSDSKVLALRFYRRGAEPVKVETGSEGGWYVSLEAPPKPEDCPGERGIGRHPVNGSWCQFCGWREEKPATAA